MASGCKVSEAVGSAALLAAAQQGLDRVVGFLARAKADLDAPLGRVLDTSGFSRGEVCVSFRLLWGGRRFTDASP